MKYLTAQFKKDLTSRKGFTLIELMVVIAIIAILAVIAATVYGNVQGRGRDASRAADVDAIATALETGRSNNNSTTYPVLAATMFVSGTIPTDPSGDTDAYCVASSTTAGAATPAVPATGANWPATQACPTAPAGYTTVAAGNPLASTTAFRICARLENGAGIYCKGNQQ